MKRHAFTLIELLVVISIIALLIAILLPALSKIRESSRELVCLTQVRSLGQGMMAYEADIDRVPPYIESQSHRNGPRGPVWIERLYADGYLTVDTKTESQRCPMVIQDLPTFSSDNHGSADDEDSVYSYGMNAHIGGLYNASKGDNGPGYNLNNYNAEYTLEPELLDSVRQPTKTMLLGERYLTWSYATGSATSRLQASAIRDDFDTGIPHRQSDTDDSWSLLGINFTGRKGTNNMFFVDGSGGSVKGTQTADRTTSFEEDVIFDPFDRYVP